MGEIGKERREVEFEPLTEPVTEPVRRTEPSRQEPAPPAPAPARK